MLFKEIRIYPSIWHLDVIISSNHDRVAKFLDEQYGIQRMERERDL